MKKIAYNFKFLIKNIIKKAFKGDIFNTSIIVTYFVLLTFVPIVMFIGNVLPLAHVNANKLLPYLSIIFPHPIYKFLSPLVRKFLTHGSRGMAFFSIVFTLWAASRGINALKRSMNQIFNVGDSQGFVVTTIISIMLTIGFGILIVLIFLAYSFGEIILQYVISVLHLSTFYLHIFLKYRFSVTFAIIFTIMCIIYSVLPNVKAHWHAIWPGALIATFGWMTLTSMFTFYIKYVAYRVLSYGTLGTFLVLLFWMNFSNWIILFGSILNSIIEEYIHGEIVPKQPKLGVIFSKHKK